MADETQGAPTPEPESVPAPEAAPAPVALIYLDVDDEITSAAARIRGAAAERVALVLPYGSRLATSRINFRLLAREAAARGKHLELICADASARSLAQAAGLPVHPSVAAFEGRGPAAGGSTTGGSEAGITTGALDVAAGATAGTAGRAAAGNAGAEDDTSTRRIAIPRRSTPRVPIVGPPRPPVRPRLAIAAGAALLVLILVGATVGVDLLPSATIVLHPRSEEIGPLEVSVEAHTDVVAADPANLVIPAQLIPFELEASDTFPATGVKTVETKATGNVKFSNFDTGGANQISAGAIVKTKSGIEFVTLDTVTLPNATIEFPFTIVPSTATVGVEAVESGPDGNVNNNTITIVPKGENKNLLTVTNVEATTGGAKNASPVVSAADIETAKAVIASSLATDLDQQVAAGADVPENLTLYPQTRTVGEVQYAQDPAKLVGAEVVQFSLSATAQGTAIGVDESPIAGIAESRLGAAVRTGWSLLPETISADVGEPAILGTILAYPVTVSGTQVRDIDEPALRAAVAGLVVAEARSRLDDYGDVEITVWPDWVTTVPKHQDRITFQLGSPQPSASPP